MKRSFEVNGYTVVIEAKVWQKPERPTMVFFSRNGKQEAAWNVTEQKWSPTTKATKEAFLNGLKATFADVMEITSDEDEEYELPLLDFAKIA